MARLLACFRALAQNDGGRARFALFGDRSELQPDLPRRMRINKNGFQLTFFASTLSQTGVGDWEIPLKGTAELLLTCVF